MTGSQAPEPLDAKPDFAQAQLPGAELHRVLAAVRSRAPVTQVDFAGKPTWLITGYSALQAAFKDERAFPAGEWYRRAIEPTQGRTFESMDGAEHHLTRRLATPAFRSRVVDRMEREGLARLAHELADGFAREPQVDLLAAFVSRFPFLVLSRVLGIPAERESEFVSWALGILRFDARSAREFTRIVVPVLEERRAEPREDVLSELIGVEIEGRRFSDEEVLSHVRLLFSAGATTTMDGLGNLLWTLFTHPEHLAAARSEAGHLERCIEELLRWETPVALLPRLCLTGVETQGCEIEPESMVLFGIAAANRDPSVFDRPDAFDPGRDAKRKLSFGLGSHSCPGLHLARTNLRVAAQVLLERFPSMELVDEVGARPCGTTLRGPSAMQVRLATVPIRATLS